MAKIEKIKLGSQGLEVSRQGLGCMGMSAFYGPAKPESDMIDLIHHAIDTGITFLDTSDAKSTSRCIQLMPHSLEWSLWTRDAEEEIVPACRELGIGIVAY
ncbi:hypothetical protein IFM89_029188 [Coptis chinensis]|uniref:Aldo/keto reductase n=1 Tax=Coptis chinensis TaxID=261450 RepID=A0A835M6X6_9MAGN|nr:hypothetical protein IFM89_029188 [Coptis chinensis]